MVLPLDRLQWSTSGQKTVFCRWTEDSGLQLDILQWSTVVHMTVTVLQLDRRQCVLQLDRRQWSTAGQKTVVNSWTEDSGLTAG